MFTLLSPPCFAADNIWQFDPELERIYRLVLNLQTDQAYAELGQLKNANEFHRIYIQSLLETVDLLITEDGKRFEKVNELFKQRIEKISQLQESPETLFIKAELNLQRGFNLLNLDHDLNDTVCFLDRDKQRIFFEAFLACCVGLSDCQDRI